MDNSRMGKMRSLALSSFLIIVFCLVVVNYIVITVRLRPYTISSKGIRTLAEKVQKIEPHFKLPSIVEDIEYYCEVRPSSIGPSHYSDVIAVKVLSSNINTWLKNYSYTSGYDDEEMLSSIEKNGDILLTNAIWRHSSKSKVYVNGVDSIIVFQTEGILIIERAN